MSAKRCGICGRDPAAGFAKINDTWYCHGDEDPEPTCYMRATWDFPDVPAASFLFAGGGAVVSGTEET
jgi:hypothetical protein